MWKKIKNMKINTKLTMYFVAMMILLMVSFFLGYQGAKQIIDLPVAEQDAYLSKIANVTAIEFFIAIFFGTITAVLVFRRIRRSLSIIKTAADEMKAGNVDVVLDNDVEDEFGLIMNAFQQVADSVKEQAEVVRLVAEGDFTVEITPKSDEDMMGQALKKMVESNHYAIGNIKEAAYQVTTSSSQVASASEALAQGSTEQASAIEQITASIAAVAEGTKQNASQANVAADLMKQAIANVKKGNDEMNEMVTAMADINQSSESISKIIKVIDDIAFQTNILALNAAVEAARAGEAGKGFAVVAEEVRNLAAKSAAAAAETAELIEDSIKKVGVGTRIANNTANALQEITDVVTESENLIVEIAEASNDQATAITQIDQAIDQVSQVVQTNSATSEECAAASVELSVQAGRVRELVSVYKLEEASLEETEKAPKTRKRRQSVEDKNEKEISLKDGFGKY